MRKWIDILACAAAVCCFAACQFKEEAFAPGKTALTATTESDGPDTRTTLAEAGTGLSQVFWSENDLLDVYMDGRTSPVPFSLVQGAGTKTGVFHGEGEASRYIAFYPHSMTPSLGSGETIRFTLPATQDYAEGTFASGAFPMTAVASSNSLQFHNLCSVLRISMTGHNVVTRIVFRSNDSAAKVRGRATVSLSDPSYPVLQLTSDACDSLVLSVPNVKLKETEDTHFFLVLPPQTYKGGFTVRIYTNKRYMDKQIRSDFTMKRSRLHKAGSFVFEPNGFDDSTYLEGNGTESDPFLIDSLGDLLLMQEAVNTENGTIPNAEGNEITATSAHYLMTSDIDLSLVCGSKLRKNWTPIGNYNRELSFNGVFNGGGHVIRNLYINANNSNYQGLFGCLNGSVRNLTVEGEVTGDYYCGLLAGYTQGVYSTLENCTTRGAVTGRVYAAGLTGYGQDANILYCRNEASVKGTNDLGGIVGYAYFVGSLDHCTNSGPVSGSNFCGGLAGYLNGSKVFNGTNSGAVTASYYVGGIGGQLYQGGKIYNSINSGNVQGEQCVGGVAGLVSAKAIAYQGPGTVANSVNLGKVVHTGNLYAGALAGYAGLPENDTPLGDEPVSGGWVKNSYWLDSVNPGLPAAGGGPGIVENVFSLTDAQMKGAPYSGVLYALPDGSGYNQILDALNAGAVAWSRNTPVLGGESRDHFPLAGWEYLSSNAYPSLTDLEALMPGGDNQTFFLSNAKFAFNAVDNDFEVDVTSSHGYSLGTLPAWIRETKVVSYEHRPHMKTHHFTVAVNPGKESRSATLTFTNTAGTTLTVRVDQEGVYLETAVTEITFDCEESSKRLNLKSSTRWTIESSADWCQVSPRTGAGDGVASVHALENAGDRARSATLTITSADGTIVRTVSVVQSGHTTGESLDWTKESFVHKSLVMRLTATWCGWCPRMNKSIKRAMELYPGKISYMALHSGGSDLQFDQAGPLQSLFNIYSYPTGIIDGRILVNNEPIETTAANIVKAVKETESTYGTVTGVDIRSTVSGRAASVDVGVYVKKAGDYKITVLLLEDGIINEQSDYEEEDHPYYVHDNVIRVAMSNVLGDAFNVTSDNTVKNLSFSAGIPASCKLENMRVLVYVQRKFGSYPVIHSGNFGDYFVDNSADVALGESLKLALEGSGGGGGGGNSGDNEGIVPGDDIDM